MSLFSNPYNNALRAFYVAHFTVGKTEVQRELNGCSLNAQPQASEGCLPFYQDLQPALAPVILPSLLHPIPDTPPPTPFSPPSSPSSVFLRPSAPMMTSNSNSDREWSAGRNSARQPISVRTEKWGELQRQVGRESDYTPLCVTRRDRQCHQVLAPQTENPDKRLGVVQIHIRIWNPSGFRFSSTQNKVNQQHQLHAWFYWFLQRWRVYPQWFSNQSHLSLVFLNRFHRVLFKFPDVPQCPPIAKQTPKDV